MSENTDIESAKTKPPEDISVRLARYGITEPDAFVHEMHERTGLVGQPAMRTAL